MRLLPYLPMIAIMGTSPAFAQPADPAQAPIRALDDALLGIMRSGKAAGIKARAAAIAPAIDRTFDLPLMTRLTIGPAWTGIASADQTALVAAFRRMTISQYAANFDSFSGQRFQLDPKVDARGGDRLVRTTLIDPGSAPVAISYRMRQSGGAWKAIDVFYRDSISQLATRRSDFAGVLASGGAKALVTHLDGIAAKAGG